MARKSKAEKLQELLEKEEQLKKAKQDLKKALRAEEKKTREKCFRDTGELVENHFEIEHLSLEEREVLFSSIAAYVNKEIANHFPKQNINSEEKSGGSSEDEQKESTVLSGTREFQVS
ncbi:restriction endonuclease [Bacillus paramycoides]|uniref:restriction endonuclease n=1 Tax=Bacillus paramycoides TaxID=2026194 RepID=UPI002E1EDCE9|nr:restriction endonuclease [Bacillus paramycoides]